MLLYDGVCSQVMGVLTGGAFLVAFALMLGASNKVIGLIAALGPITQLLQIPTIYLVDYVRLRKALVVISSFFSRIFWFVVATLPWLVPTEYRVTALILCIFFYFVFGTVSGCAFNSWIRDLIPQETMGAYFGKRMAVSTATGALLTMIAGFTIEWLKNTYSGQIAYGVFFLVGAASGMFGGQPQISIQPVNTANPMPMSTPAAQTPLPMLMQYLLKQKMNQPATPAAPAVMPGATPMNMPVY